MNVCGRLAFSDPEFSIKLECSDVQSSLGEKIYKIPPLDAHP